MARVVVVGGGLGGTAAAVRLAKLGHDVTLVERRDRVGGALGTLRRDGFAWDTGASSTALPAVLRDLWRKSGRPLERELELLPVQPMREHRFPDGSFLALPSGSRSAQAEAVDAALGPGGGEQWVDYTHSFADTWDALRRGYLERRFDRDHASADVLAVLGTRRSLRSVARRRLADPRLRALALHSAVLDGQDPRRTPAWAGMTSYVEQNFGTWTVPGGMGRLAEALTARLAQRKVKVLLESVARDVVLANGRAAGVSTDAGVLDADVVVCAVDPRRLPSLAPLVRRTTPALPPAAYHLGLTGPAPELPPEVVLHGDPMLVVRTTGTAPGGGHAWTVLARGRVARDPLDTLAERGLDVRSAVEVRVDRSPQQQIEEWGGSPYGVLWQGRRTLEHRLTTRTPFPGVHCAGAAVSLLAGLPYVGLTAAVVAAEIGPA
jgi:phytoene dehydrogenase-like protein